MGNRSMTAISLGGIKWLSELTDVEESDMWLGVKCFLNP